MIRVWVRWPNEQDWKIEVPIFRNLTAARAYVRDMRRLEPSVTREVRKWVADETTGGKFVKV